jgi:hypothetical protein
VSNALVVPLATDRDSGHSRRPNANFIAHLIATAAQAPQTRARRRAEPEVAAAAYRALGQWPTAGAAVSRAL